MVAINFLIMVITIMYKISKNIKNKKYILKRITGELISLKEDVNNRFVNIDFENRLKSVYKDIKKMNYKDEKDIVLLSGIYNDICSSYKEIQNLDNKERYFNNLKILSERKNINKKLEKLISIFQELKKELDLDDIFFEKNSNVDKVFKYMLNKNVSLFYKGCFLYLVMFTIIMVSGKYLNNIIMLNGIYCIHILVNICCLIFFSVFIVKFVETICKYYFRLNNLSLEKFYVIRS